MRFYTLQEEMRAMASLLRVEGWSAYARPSCMKGDWGPGGGLMPTTALRGGGGR